MLRKLLQALLISLLLLDVCVQAKHKSKGTREKIQREKQYIDLDFKRNDTFPLLPRTFNADIARILNLRYGGLSTALPSSSSSSSSTSSPQLVLRVNSTAEYFTGILSTRIIPTAYTVAIIIGIPSNAVALGSLSAKTKTFSAAILFFSLALSDLLFLLTLTLKVLYHVHGNNWVFGETMCKLVTACFYGNVYCSIYTLTCISFKRYLAIVHPFTYKSLPKRSCATWSVLIVWTVSFAAMVPEFLIRQSYQLHHLGITTCHDVLPLSEPAYSFLPYYKLSLACVGFLLPFATTVFSYIFIIHQLNKSHQDWAYYIKMSTLVFTMFIVCFTPSNVINIIHYTKVFTGGGEHLYICYNVAMCLCSLHSCLDPFLLSLMTRSTGPKLHYETFKGKSLSISI